MPAAERRGDHDLLSTRLRTRRAARRLAPAPLGSGAPEGRPPMRRETFPASGPIRLDLHVPAGEIVVEAGDVAEPTVELEPLGGEECRRAGDEARVGLPAGEGVGDVAR